MTVNRTGTRFSKCKRVPIRLGSDQWGMWISYVAYRISEVRASQKSIPLAYQASMALSPAAGGGKGTFPWDAHLPILAHGLLHGLFPFMSFAHSFSKIVT